MHTNILNSRQVKILEILSQLDFIEDFYLAGGTALALQYGHRESVDFDFFTQKTFVPEELFGKLSSAVETKRNYKSEGTLGIFIEQVTCSFFKYEYPILHDFITFKNRVKLASVADISAMKVAAISDRGKKRDFIDLYFICQTDCSLKEAIDFYGKKYDVFGSDLYHVYTSLIYFKDTEKDEMPQMFEKTDWEQIKNYFTEEVSKLILT
jgi:predicted nucleotidyltransferase component of viral defense system